jgi:hypothetical protein
MRTTSQIKTVTPGPGTYRAPSDFGYLDFKPKSGYTPGGSIGIAQGSYLSRAHMKHGSVDGFDSKHNDVTVSFIYKLSS